MFKYSFFALLLLFSSNNLAQQITSTLIERVETAQEQLSKVQANINKEHQSLAKHIENALLEIRTLRQQAAHIQRAEDEQLMSLEALKSRLEAWQNQQNYQQQLIKSFQEQTHFKIASQEHIIDPSLIETFLESKLSPSWQERQLIDNNNQLNRFDTIAFGPIAVAVNDNSAGFINSHSKNIAELQTVQQSDVLFKNLSTLRQQGQADIYFDPTLGNADKLNQQQLSISGYIKKGGVWAYPILLFALVASLVALGKAWQLLLLPKLQYDAGSKIEEHINNNDLDSLTVYIQSLNHIQQHLIYIAQSSPVSQKRDDDLIAQLKSYKYNHEKYLGVITTCATIAPLLGLLGTVSGMIHTFMMMNIFGSGDASVVSGGISQALITTELGLIVAIPALIVGALLNKKSKSYDAHLETIATKLSKLEFNSQQVNHGQ